MTRIKFYTVILLTGTWMILFERYTLFAVVSGIAAGSVCVFICSRLIPLPRMAHIRVFWLFVYVFYLLGQLFVSALRTVAFIFSGATVQVAEIKTSLSHHFLRIILANSITLTPGTVLLGMEGDNFTVAYLKGKKKGDFKSREEEEMFIKGRMEKMLKKAEEDSGRAGSQGNVSG